MKSPTSLGIRTFISEGLVLTISTPGNSCLGKHGMAVIVLVKDKQLALYTLLNSDISIINYLHNACHIIGHQGTVLTQIYSHFTLDLHCSVDTLEYVSNLFQLCVIIHQTKHSLGFPRSTLAVCTVQVELVPSLWLVWEMGWFGV